MEQQSSAELHELAKAFSAAQAEMPLISMDKQVSFKNVQFEYASLSNIIASTKPVLSKHGLSILQFPSTEESKVVVKTMLLHTSGQFITTTITGRAAKTEDPKDLGSMITYLRRYAYGSVVGIALDGDYDATTISEKYLGTGEHKVWLRDLLIPHGIDSDGMRRVSDEMIRGNYEMTEEAASKAMEILRR